MILPVRINEFRSSTMPNLATTRMSSKGQVVIPENIRKQLKLKEGSQFVVLGKDDVVILKAISPHAMEESDALITTPRKQAKQTGMKQSDLAAAIGRWRGGR